MTIVQFKQFKNVVAENKLLGVIEKISEGIDRHVFIDEYNGEFLTKNFAVHSCQQTFKS